MSMLCEVVYFFWFWKLDMVFSTGEDFGENDRGRVTCDEE